MSSATTAVKVEILSNVASKKDVLGWENKSMMVPHEPIRNDLRLMTEIVTADNFVATQSWKAKVFFDWYDRYFYSIVHHHHDIEEKIFFPWIREKVEVPKRLSEEHVELIQRLDSIKAKRKAFEALIEQTDTNKWKDSVSALSKEVKDLEKYMVEHLDAEEESTAPLLKAHFTPKEHDAVTLRILQSLDHQTSADMLPWIIQRMYFWGGEAEVRTFLRSMPLPPRLLYKFVWKSKYEKNNRAVLESLRLDVTKNPKAAKGSCSVM